MLQQTVVQAVIPHYEHWMNAFPTLKKLSRAQERSMMLQWEGLGYYSRVRNICRAARIMVRDHGGRVPGTHSELTALPGIGEYTACAILSLGFNAPYPVLDANIRRIGQRLFAVRHWNGQWEKALRSLLEENIPRERPGEFNESLMELGQTVCIKSRPRCDACPLNLICQAYAAGAQNKIPETRQRSVARKETRIILLIKENMLTKKTAVWLTRRNLGVLKGLWLFPGIDQSQVDTDLASQETIKRNAEFLGALPTRTHFYTRFRETLHPVIYRASSRKADKLVTKLNGKGRWVPLSAAARYPLPSVYRRVLGDLETLLKSR
ncbi:MAG TPA: NUDIX domain-containing protein [Spirochaetia bacterium]|nr:NUDIX domain-containing protein [Spirochaetia bacterium]